MTKFDMDIRQNFASFKFNDKIMFIESFDNINFEVRVGANEKSEYLTKINAQSSESLNSQLQVLANNI